MKIQIISDIHDNLVNLEKCLNFGQQNNCEAIICCGDVSNNETLDYLNQNTYAQIHLVRGNMEIFSDSEVGDYKKIKYYGYVGRISAAGKNIGFCHEPFRIDDVLKLGECDIIFHGHTHKPWQEEKNRCQIVNPGNVAGMLHKATFAIWNAENNQLSLHIIDEL